ncbi:hypothetical protein QR680_006855 [Steinernema hermaphroditum]|uniref:isocitrate lyase n=1 Tax=Steinernema hermaphroditum TaxID=289476 RepID=A0AA39HWP8_9BILA|nr:hypothetical protein QR680_006855 [Steinernema hermaphroditum]
MEQSFPVPLSSADLAAYEDGVDAGALDQSFWSRELQQDEKENGVAPSPKAADQNEATMDAENAMEEDSNELIVLDKLLTKCEADPVLGEDKTFIQLLFDFWVHGPTADVTRNPELITVKLPLVAKYVETDEDDDFLVFVKLLHRIHDEPSTSKGLFEALAGIVVNCPVDLSTEAICLYYEFFSGALWTANSSVVDTLADLHAVLRSSVHQNALRSLAKKVFVSTPDMQWRVRHQFIDQFIGFLPFIDDAEQIYEECTEIGFTVTDESCAVNRNALEQLLGSALSVLVYKEVELAQDFANNMIDLLACSEKFRHRMSFASICCFILTEQLIPDGIFDELLGHNYFIFFPYDRVAMIRGKFVESLDRPSVPEFLTVPRRVQALRRMVLKIAHYDESCTVREAAANLSIRLGDMKPSPADEELRSMTVAEVEQEPDSSSADKSTDNLDSIEYSVDSDVSSCSEEMFDSDDSCDDLNESIVEWSDGDEEEQAEDVEAQLSKPEEDLGVPGIKRNYEVEDVLRLKGSIDIDYTLANRGANRLWQLLHTEPFVAALGAQTGNQAVQMVRAGLKAIYLSGWQVAADANTAGDMYPDQSLRSLRADLMEATPKANDHLAQHRLVLQPIVADAEAGFGGALNCFEVMKGFIEAGASGVHFEDQLGSEKKCGHMGGKVLVPTRRGDREAERRAPRRRHVLGVADRCCDIDEQRPSTVDYAAGRTAEGFFRLKEKTAKQACIDRAIAYAPYTDLIWMETSHPGPGRGTQFPDKMFAYNCSPSFNWKAHLRASDMEKFQRELGAMGFKYQFITLAGFHANSFSIYDLARKYKDHGMAAYSELQEREFASEK